LYIDQGNLGLDPRHPLDPMIAPSALYDALAQAGVRFYAGVPDSLLKDFCAFVSNNHPSSRHVIAANEGSAVALACGFHMATSTLPLVYLQNSGLGNMVNPLVSLADPTVYGIPLIILLGWRGELFADGTQIRDEPQHVRQGAITSDLLESLGIPFRVLADGPEAAVRQVNNLAELAKERSGPVALVVRKGTFEKCTLEISSQEDLPTREDALAAILANIPADTLVVSTTGKTSRELFELRMARDGAPAPDFLTVGSMGHASQIAAGVCLGIPDRRVCCLDGDGSVIMHMGGLSTTASLGNLTHIVINNGAHESVGGQPTQGFAMDFCAIALALGYGSAQRAKSISEILEVLGGTDRSADRSRFLEVQVRVGSRDDLGRPTRSPAQTKLAFMEAAAAILRK
jgi:phosphonopyruvate decarboxylase